MPDHPEAAGDIIEDLAMVLADGVQPPTATRAAGAAVGSMNDPRGFMSDDLSRQMVRQRPAYRMALAVIVVGDRGKGLGW